MNDPAPHLLFAHITWAQLEAECRRELEARERFYPGRVSKGNMLADEAADQLAIARAWLEDVGRIRACWHDRPGSPPTRPTHDLPWRIRRAALQRELALRRNVYPRDVAGGKLLEADAQRRLDCLACLLAIYEDGWDWLGSDGRLPGASLVAEREWLEHTADVDRRRNPERVKELAP